MPAEGTTSSAGATSSSGEDRSYIAARQYLVDQVFQQSDTRASCLSDEPHDLRDVLDLRCHFFGCLGIEPRVKVLEDAEHSIWKQAEKLEKENTEPHRRNIASSPDLGLKDEDEDPPDMRYITALSLQAELKRIAVLRRTPALKKLVREVRDSIHAWKDENKDNIRKVKESRVDTVTFMPHSPIALRRLSRSQGGALESRTTQGPDGPDGPDGPNDPDITQGRCNTMVDRSSIPEHNDILQKVLRKIIAERRSSNENPEPEDYSLADYDLKRDIKARLIKLERPDPSESDANSLMAGVMEPDWEDVDNKIFKSTFPDQQVSIHHLLSDKFQRAPKTYESAAEKACPAKIRYYHIPVNNMMWVEQAIASYFGESGPEPVGNFDSCPRTNLVLQDYCWRGQEHGCAPDSTIVHNRNLRPLCEKISTDLEDLYLSGENTQKSLVLFMPYLHWETDRRRNHAANLIKQLADEHDLDRRETAKMWKIKRKHDRSGLEPASPSRNSMSAAYKEPNYYTTRGKDRDQILEALANILWEKIRKDTDGLMPPYLVHMLWQRIRDEAYEDKLLVALRSAFSDRVKAGGFPQILEPFVWEDPEHRELRDFKYIIWRIKEAGKGFLTPHALEDILWEEMKKARLKADKEKEPGDQSQVSEENSTTRRDIFQRPTTLFVGVKMDEYGHLKPTNRLAKVLVNAARLFEQMMTYPDQKIMEEYLFKHPSLHPRRTLDQGYFWRLRTTHIRDRDQVVYRSTNAKFAHKYRPPPTPDHELKKPASFIKGNSQSSVGYTDGSKTTRKDWMWTRHGEYEQKNGCEQCDDDIRKLSRVVMVDQLWMWVLDRDTILTCFPQRYGVCDKDPSGVHQSIRMRVKTRSNPDNHVRSIFDLALIILDECFNVFFNRTRTADKRPQVLDIFAESIGRVTDKQAIAFKHLWTLSERLTEIYQTGVEDKVDPSLMLALLNVTPEAELQREIHDIINELDIILNIVGQQEEMITRFVKLAKEILLPPVDTELPKDTLRMMKQQHDVFEGHAGDLLSEVKDRKTELGALKSSAESAAQNVNDLLSLKQQQASVVQAYEAMKQGEETVRQGKSIMVFTVMTIIFLPLSFMSSLFGMNAVELTGTDPSPGGDTNSTAPVPDEIVAFWPTTFKRQILIMFTVSFGAVLAVIVPAFSPFIRASISSVLKLSITKLITSWPHMYRLWLRSGWNSNNLRNRAGANVSKMKKAVRDDLNHKRMVQSEIWDGVRNPGVKKSLLEKRPSSVEGEEKGEGVTNGENGRTSASRRWKDVEMAAGELGESR